MPSGPLETPILKTTKPELVSPDPKREYVVGFWNDWSDAVYSRLSSHANAIVLQHGDALIDAMLSDPTVKACVVTLKSMVLADGIQIVPMGTSDDSGSEDAENSAKVYEFCMRCLENLDEDLEDLAWGLLDAIPYGCQLAEVVYAEGTGQDEGKFVLDRIAVKPRGTWNFVVNESGRIIGYQILEAADQDGARTRARTTKGQIMPSWKFVRYSWMQKGSDPRGTSAIVPAAYDPWNLKRLAIPEWWRYVSRFGSPFLFGTTAENAQDVQVRDESGAATGKTVTAQEAMLASLLELPKKKAAAAGYGSDIKVLNPAGDGGVFREAFNQWDTEIATAILGLVRPAVGMTGGKNNRDSPSDDMAAIIRVGKRSLGRAIRQQLLWPLVELNFGKEFAIKYTPAIRLGMVDMAFFSRVANAVARLASAGLIPRGSEPDILAWLGLDSVVGRKTTTQPVQGGSEQSD